MGTWHAPVLTGHKGAPKRKPGAVARNKQRVLRVQSGYVEPVRNRGPGDNKKKLQQKAKRAAHLARAIAAATAAAAPSGAATTKMTIG